MKFMILRVNNIFKGISFPVFTGMKSLELTELYVKLSTILGVVSEPLPFPSVVEFGILM